ncbi:TetR/AcrR family transcriptional regulator [Streptomyces sp. RB6PN25]|uniref:TetR/AcrR family transcriptional regulator n=1 Tax=Streptomyces humicola TaxID=2953240 RepID=A0ABT1Q0J3_9ACTN|nr:TetR/AcrR family transcriptional regulator [Streptomyces humicola]MCQ4082810.1 TetR/AcrR family transcriptional regulator [Streptomyces humicola]
MSAEENLDTRERILIAAADLLAEGGADAVSTRAVSAAAGVQAPTLYRLFGDKKGLLDAVTAYGFERYLADKQAMAVTEDPVEDLRRGWDLHVEFGLTHPSFYVLMYGAVRPGERPTAAEDTHRILLAMLGRAARAGRLRVPVEQAAQMIQATSTGVALALISAPSDARDLGLSTRTRDAVLATLTTQAAPADGADSVASRAIALDAVLPRSPGSFTAAEAALLREWLGRLASAP